MVYNNVCLHGYQLTINKKKYSIKHKQNEIKFQLLTRLL